MFVSHRRAFLGGLAGLGGVLALGPSALPRSAASWANPFGDDAAPLDFGRFEALAALIQETAPDELQTALIAKLRAGTTLEDVVAACALANARSFGGRDYTGYHCLMALTPALAMAGELDEPLRALPVLKVVHRTASRIQDTGGRDDALTALEVTTKSREPRAIWNEFVARDMDGAERALIAASRESAEQALQDLQSILREHLDVHRIVLAWRAWDLMQLTGEAHAATLMRQSVRFCVAAEQTRIDRKEPTPRLRELLPELMEKHGLAKQPAGTRPASDAELDELANVVFASGRDEAARATAAALASGMAHADVGRALSFAANRLLLHDPGRPRDDGPSKPRGSVHGASTGVHASDAARAWRNLAAVSTPADAAANLIAGAHHTAGQSAYVGREPLDWSAQSEGLSDKSAHELLRTLGEAVAHNDQPLACACAAKYGEAELDPEPLFASLLRTAVDADGALHAEKYYRTVREDFADARPRHRWSHAIALARVSASEHGFAAPGLAEARAALRS